MTIGKVTIYYENITKVDLSNIEKGNATVQYHVAEKPHRFVLDQRKFLTNARKDFKVNANTKEKINNTLKQIRKQRIVVRDWKKQQLKKS